MNIDLYNLKIAVLFLIVNRLNTIRQVFAEIKKAKPPRLYIASDGARNNVEGEIQKVKDVRDFVISNINWDCEVKTLFRDKNLGCKYAVSGAIDWFFEQEEMGIILEDDCVPSQSFFRFCEELLIKYKDDTRIGQICGFNPAIKFNNDESYLFAKSGSIWGWATWSRAWQNYDVKISSWKTIKDTHIFDDIVDSKLEKAWRRDVFDKVYYNKIDTWDYQWSYTKLVNGFYSIVPSKNLIRNIGFGDGATHTKGKIDKKLLISYEIDDMIHPKFIVRNKDFDAEYLKNYVGLNKRNLFKTRLINIIK